MNQHLQITHHGAVDGVTGSCHRLTLPGGDAVLVDCGLFQGAETSGDGAGAARLEINFDISTVRALLVTHVHIDHVGRIPYLLAADFTAGYAQLKHLWDAEARRKLKAGRHPLAFEQVTTIPDHHTHLRTVDYLAKTARPAIVIAASGMCSGGRIVNYLKAMLGDARHDVLFCGYQAAGTPGRAIQTYGPKGGYVDLDAERITVRAGIHTLGGYSAHADQKNLLDFIGRMRVKPLQMRVVHEDGGAKASLAGLLRKQHPGMEVVVP